MGGKDLGGFILEVIDIFIEGLVIFCLKLVYCGEKCCDVIKLVECNNCFVIFFGDLVVMIGGVQMVAWEYQVLICKYGIDNV